MKLVSLPVRAVVARVCREVGQVCPAVEEAGQVYRPVAEVGQVYRAVLEAGQVYRPVLEAGQVYRPVEGLQAAWAYSAQAPWALARG